VTIDFQSKSGAYSGFGFEKAGRIEIQNIFRKKRSEKAGH
jgi:hypothetical protein